MKKYLVFIVCAVLACNAQMVSAQSFMSVPYSMGFEDSEAAELSQWVLNPGSQAAACNEQWMVGSSMKNAGSKSLYVSNDSASARFGAKPNLQYAYRDVLLPSGTYDLSFDWYCEGSASATLQVGYIQGTAQTLDANAASGSPLPAVAAYVKTTLKGSTSWKNESLQFKSRGTAIRIFFAWCNNNSDTTLVDAIGACVDNVQITSANCKRPYNIQASQSSCDTAIVSWEGTSGGYEFAYRRVGTDVWHTTYDIPGGISASAVIKDLDEGTYDFRVRGICTPDTSAWAYESEFVVFCPERHCVNFTDLAAPTVTCTYGTTGDSYSSSGQKAYDNVGIVDFGPESMNSRHTVNWDRMATDPRTGNHLKLIPTGGYASVRLGNWDTGNGAESVSYQYPVDSVNSILLLKYAAVLEDPDHGEDDQPRFVLEILDSLGNKVDPTCGYCNFSADSKRSGWHTEGSGYNLVAWKDWTVVGLNLSDYIGHTLTIRLTTYDCFWSGHYGYAYFTLDCARATIETSSCALDPSVGMRLTAPEGFRYEWYDKYDRLVSQDRTFDPMDTTTYRCVVISKESDDCFFELYSQCKPHRPMPQFSYKHQPAECLNTVKMTNESFVRIVQHNDTLDEARQCDEYLWETWGGNMQLQTSSNVNPSFVYPNEGGTYFVKLTASLDGNCSDDTVMQITVPAIREYYEEFDSTLCEGSFIQWGSMLIAEEGTYPLSMKTIYGCDSTRVMTVHVAKSYNITLDTAYVCFGEKYCVDGDCYRKSESGMFIRNLTTKGVGCDSTILQYVQYLDEIIPDIQIDSINLEKEKYTADIYVGGTGFSQVKCDYINEDGDSVHLSLLPGDTIHNLNVNYYSLHFSNDYGCTLDSTILIGGTCLDVEIGAQQSCDKSEPVIIYPLNVKEGMATKYWVSYSEEAKAAGFVNDTAQVRGGEIRLTIPQGAEPNNYQATITFQDMVCGNKEFAVNMHLTYPASVVFYRWNDVISLKNKDAAGYPDSDLYAFDSYQWYLNGEPIEGANLSYYNAVGGLDMDGEYELEMTRADGVKFVTCPFVPNRATAINDIEADVLVTPTVVRGGETVTIQTPFEGVANLVTMAGQHVCTFDLLQGVNPFVAPSAAGMYIMNVHTREGNKAVRLIVK